MKSKIDRKSFMQPQILFQVMLLKLYTPSHSSPKVSLFNPPTREKAQPHNDESQLESNIPSVRFLRPSDPNSDQSTIPDLIHCEDDHSHSDGRGEDRCVAWREQRGLIPVADSVRCPQSFAIYKVL